MTINILPDEIVNQIAAGEVIENPSAVVKELVENSIDAGSNLIEIEIFNSGFDKIIIKDNGCGIEKSELIKVPMRHATSKITNFNDLYSIKTMGFRGEAMASIFSVAKTRVISKVEDNDSYEINSENTNEIKKSSCNLGTTIIVEDLFYNVPARKKYLKSPTLELKSIIETVRRFCVVYNNCKFILKHDDKILINKPIFESVSDNLIYVLDRDLKNNLLEINSEEQGISVTGFIAKPAEITYAYKKNQYTFVNNRFVKSKLINDAIISGFTSNLMEHRHPMFVINIEIDPEIIDVNVHPTKTEIRFENELEIFEFVKKSIKRAFEINTNFKEFEEEKVQERQIKLSEIDEVEFEISEKIQTPKIESKNYFTEDKQKTLEVKEDVVDYQKSFISEVPKVEISEEIKKGPLSYAFENYRIIGQMHKTYIIVETKGEMYLIDQHAAEEKVFYEKFVQDFKNSCVKKQNLLKSVIINLTPEEMLILDENKNIIKKMGFNFENYGGSDIIVRTVPIDIFGKPMNVEKLKEILYDLTIDKKSEKLEEINLAKLASRSCRTAIKGGDELTYLEMKKLIEELKKIEEPFNCPHGRPTILKWSFYELEKKFKRIV